MSASQGPSWWATHPITGFVPVQVNSFPEDLRPQLAQLITALNLATKNAQEIAVRDHASPTCPANYKQQSFLTWFHASKAQNILRGAVPAILHELLETIEALGNGGEVSCFFIVYKVRC
jgi:hypothetical protein